MKLPARIFLTLITMGVYWNTLPNQFVAGDRQFILRNQKIGSFDTVVNAFSTDYWEKLGGESFIYYRPVTIFTHFLDVRLYGFNPAGHHFSNMIVHTIVTLMVFQLFLHLFAPRLLIPLIGASLFALHPIHTPAVSYIMGRTDLLAALFSLGGLLLLIPTPQEGVQRSSRARIAAACLCYFLGLLSKEMAVTLPLLFVLYWFFWPSDRPSWKDPRFIVPLLSLCATGALYLVLRFSAVGFTLSEDAIPPWYSWWQRGSLVIIICGYYLQKLLFPLNLCYYSNLPVPGSWLHAVASPYFWTGILFAVSCPIALRRAPRLGFALGWIATTLLPVLNIIWLPEQAKEHFLYIPSVGFCLLFPLLAQSLAGDVHHKRTRILGAAVTAAALIGLLYSGATLRRNTDYRCPVTFLESTLEKMKPVPPHLREDTCFFEGVKNTYLTYRNLGILHQELGQWDEAGRALEKALQFTPSYFPPIYTHAVQLSLGTVYEKMGRLEEAQDLLLQARPTAPRPSRVDNLLGVIAVREGKRDKAEFYFKRAIEADTTYATAYYNLGLLYMDSQETHKGSQALREAARLHPHYSGMLSRYAPSPEGEGADGGGE